LPNRPIPAEIAVWGALISALLLFGATTLATYRSTSQLTPVLEEVERTRTVEVVAAQLLSDFREAQAERRAFLLSGDPYFLQAHRAAVDSTRRRLAMLDSVTHRDSSQANRARELALLLDRADSVARVTISVRQTQGLQAAAALVASRAGSNVAEDLERAVRIMEVVEQERLAAALDEARLSAQQAQNTVIWSGIIALLLLPAGTYIIWKDLLARRSTARQLRHAMRGAESATVAKSQFLASMSHEIRTPLNGVIGMTELALDTDLTPTQRDYLQTSRTSAESLLRLLNDILDFSKIEAGRLDVERTAFPLRDIIGETLRTLTVRAEQKKLELAYRVLPAVPDVLIGDPGRLQQVIVNLVGNAIKFTERGEIVVLVESQPVSPTEIDLHVSVRDTGIGIPPDRIRAVFEPFSQAESSTTRRFGGTGLGLTISEQLVKLMGGTIWVDSEAGKGSTFHFTARLGIGEQRALPRATLDQLDGLRVLVLDDHPTNRFILEEMLTHWHMRPVSAATGDEAYRMAEEAARSGAPLQVGVFDNLLPDTDGYSVAEKLVGAQLLPGSAIIILSSDNAPGNAARRATIGISRALMKPVKQSELLDAILMAAAGQSPAPGVIREQTRRWSGARVLLVEDNLVNQRVAEGLLAKRGIETTIANHGGEALEILSKSDRFDLVLMDVEMPVMDGIEATRRVRAMKRNGPRLPIIAVTAHALQEERDRCAAAGMDVCLTKPLRGQALDEVLQQFLAGVQPVASNSGPTPNAGIDAMLAMVDGDRDLLRAVAAEYHRQTPPLVNELRSAVERGDAAGVQRLAHKLKGSSLQLAGDRVGAAAATLEERAKAGEMESAPALMTQIDSALADFLRTIDRASGDGR
jgi:two-component system sensor histidine kinase/response regulator